MLRSEARGGEEKVLCVYRVKGRVGGREERGRGGRRRDFGTDLPLFETLRRESCPGTFKEQNKKGRRPFINGFH